MSDTATIPALMHFPLAKSLAKQGWRIRRSVMKLMPGESAGPGERKLAWFEKDGSLWYCSTWEQIEGDYVTVTRVVTASDFTKDDMLAEDWTVLGIECDLGAIDCACAGNDALASVPGYPVEAATQTINTSFDLLKANARMGLVGCTPGNLDGSCSCQEPSTPDTPSTPETPSTPSTTSPTVGTLSGGGSGLRGGSGSISPGGGGGANLPARGSVGGSSGGGSGGSSSKKQKTKKPKTTNSNSVTVTGSSDRDECYDSLEGTNPDRDPVSWSGNFTLNAEGDDLWFYTITFKSQIVAQGTCQPGEETGFGPLTVDLPNPGASYPIQVTCHKPFDDDSETTGSTNCQIPDYCSDRRTRDSRRSRTRTRDRARDRSRARSRRAAARRRTDTRRRTTARRRPADRRRSDARRPRRPDDRRRTSDRRRSAPPSYGITVTADADRTACYEPEEITDGHVPTVTFTGDFQINSDVEDPGTWHYTVTADGDEIGSGNCNGNESIPLPSYELHDASPGSHVTISVTADRTDGEGTANGSALGNVADECATCTGDHEHLDPESNECVCDEGYERISGTCMELCVGDHRHRDEGTLECVCDDGYEEYEGECVPVCGAAEHRDEGTGECVCDDGYERVSGVCVPVCGEHETRDGEGVCQCDAGYERVGGVCVAECGEHQHRNGEGVCVCDDNYEDVDGDCLPICGIAEHRDPGTGECVCDDGYERVGGICVAVCGANEHRDESGACVCDDGHIRDPETGLCVPE